jgi:hypothetical protein
MDASNSSDDAGPVASDQESGREGSRSGEWKEQPSEEEADSDLEEILRLLRDGSTVDEDVVGEEGSPRDDRMSNGGSAPEQWGERERMKLLTERTVSEDPFEGKSSGDEDPSSIEARSSGDEADVFGPEPGLNHGDVGEPKALPELQQRPGEQRSEEGAFFAEEPSRGTASEQPEQDDQLLLPEETQSGKLPPLPPRQTAAGEGTTSRNRRSVDDLIGDDEIIAHLRQKYAHRRVAEHGEGEGRHGSEGGERAGGSGGGEEGANPPFRELRLSEGRFALLLDRYFAERTQESGAFTVTNRAAAAREVVQGREVSPGPPSASRENSDPVLEALLARRQSLLEQIRLVELRLGVVSE